MKKKEIDEIYKSLTKAKFREMYGHLHVLSLALSHLSYTFYESSGNTLAIPLKPMSNNKIFQFEILNNEEKKEDILVVKYIGEKPPTNIH